MLDTLISRALVVDGTGQPGRVADVGINGGRIAGIGDLDDQVTAATEVIEAEGLVLCPGFVDPHTHYDAQLFWDPHASPSNLHGVTTVVSGNCGFTLAPLKSEDAEWTLEMLAEVEGMSLEALKAGVPANWETFGEYLDQLDGHLGVNAMFLVGHCALRRYVMGEDATGNEASVEQVEQMKAELRRSIESGGAGFSTTLSFTHSDGAGEPVPSRSATDDEVLALAGVVKEYEGTTLEIIVDGCLNGFTDAEVEFLTAYSKAGDRPVNWNVLTVDSRDSANVQHQLEPSRHAEANGGKVIALTMPTLVPMNMSLLTRCGLTLIPGWEDVITAPVEERMQKLADPEVRRRMFEISQDNGIGTLRRLTNWDDYHIGETFHPDNKKYEKRRVGDIAGEEGKSAWDTLLDIALADDLRTVLWPTPPENDADSWQMRIDLVESGRALVGGSDAGAHLDRMIGTTYPTQFLGDMIRGRKLISMERTVHLMTDVPAQLFGLRERGRVEDGWHADLVLFDPEEIGSGAVSTVDDLPAGGRRLFASSHGIRRVLVNGQTTVVDGESRKDLPGVVLRSGQDTYTVSAGA